VAVTVSVATPFAMTVTFLVVAIILASGQDVLVIVVSVLAPLMSVNDELVLAV
jgi:hypothetical protein